MVVIEIRFVVGRYHASPWNAEPNEGRVEWPPSPWRIARALVSAYYDRHPDLDEAVVASLVAKLGGAPPAYHLPPAVHTHTRHYMPRTDKEATRKTFDAFLRLDPDQPLTIVWERVDLTADERDVLALLLRDMGYFGRAESIAEGRVVSEPAALPNCQIDALSVTDHGELEEVLALQPPSEFAKTVAQQADELRRRWLSEEQAKAAAKGKEQPGALPKAAERKLGAILPGSPFEALCVTTEDLHKAGLSRPLGTRWLRYRREEIPMTTVTSPVSMDSQWTVALFSVAEERPPRIVDMLHHTERLHQAIVKRAGAGVLSGVDDDGRPLRGHEHAHILAEPDDHGRIRQFVVWVPAGFDTAQLEALEDIERIWDKSKGRLRLLVAGVGEVDELESATVFFARSRVWRSVTPFVLTRHPKTTRGGLPKLDTTYTVLSQGEERSLQRGSPPHDLLRLLVNRGFPRPVRIDPLSSAEFGAVSERWRNFHARRNHGAGRRGPGPGVGFEIEFDEPVAGPIVGGYGAHYGLGVFAPA